jgi:hypothetical protein
MQGAQSGGCWCHGIESGLGDATKASETWANCLEILDEACAFLRAKIMSNIVEFRVPVPNDPRWAQREVTVRVLIGHAVAVALFGRSRPG